MSLRLNPAIFCYGLSCTQPLGDAGANPGVSGLKLVKLLELIGPKRRTQSLEQTAKRFHGGSLFCEDIVWQFQAASWMRLMKTIGIKTETFKLLLFVWHVSCIEQLKVLTVKQAFTHTYTPVGHCDKSSAECLVRLRTPYSLVTWHAH